MALLIASSIFVLPCMVAAAQGPFSDNAQRALQWLACTQQQPNGQIGSGGNPIARSSEVALGLAAAGQPATAMHVSAVSLADYLKAAVSTDVGTNGELLLARASQSDAGPTAPVAAQLQASQSSSGPTAGEYGSNIFSDALAILGLRAANQPVNQAAIDFLRGQQKADGGWSADNVDQFGEDSNTTALVIQALIAAGLGPTDRTLANGFDYLKQSFSDGGFGIAPGVGADANSDELGIEAVLAAELQSDSAWSTRLQQALQYLAAQQITTGSDKGAIENPFSKLFATTEAPASFLLRPMTAVGLAQTTVALLPCSAAAPTSRPLPTGKSIGRLAQTGGGPDESALVSALLIALGVLTMSYQGTRRRGRS
jgi:hypothetical protein